MRQVVRGRARDDQRARLLLAAQRVICEHGVEALTINAVCAEARASRSTFYAVFADRMDCLLDVFDESANTARAAILRAYRNGEDWVDGVRGALVELLDFLDRYPRLAHFMIVRSLAGDAPMLARRARLLSELADALESGSPAPVAGTLPPPFGAEAIVGGVASILHARLLEDPMPSLIELSSSLMGVIVLPYLGVGAARLELSRPVPARPSAPVPLIAEEPAHLVTGHRIRVTDSMAAALLAIRERAGISNRDVAFAASVLDQGQISRLLARLRHLELIENRVPTGVRSASNSWHLTGLGEEALNELGYGAPGRAERDAAAVR